MKKKIWILNHYAIPPTMGGITRHFDYAKELVKRGYDVSIFASSFDHKQRVELLGKGEKFKIEDYSGVKFVWIKTTPYKKNDFKRVVNIFSFAKNLYFIARKFEKPDTIIASSFHPLTWVVGYRLAKGKKAEFVAEVRDLWPQSGIDLGAFKEGSLIVRLLRRLEKFIYTKAKYVITVLPKADEYIQSLGINKEKIVHIPNGCDNERFDLLKNTMPDEVKKILGEHEGYFKACYLGALGQANAMETIIEAAKYVQDEVGDKIHFLIIGDGPEKEKLQKMVKKFKLSNVFFYDPISKLSVPSLLERVDITLVSMHNLKVYRFGISLNKLFDYLCAAKPIVFAGNVANDIVKDSGAGFSCDAYDSKAFAQKIIKLYEMDEDERKRIGQKGREYVEKYHDIRKLADRLEQIINGDGNR
ncbi:glycosyl transferase, group 1 [Caldicellulosiruptor saccharolyticus DSM 8903]|uniref:Glycosyl transferase, group 1 n=1 Tax=Caldicellulosiruptor saccharolyticus (strain ATCC 43494 / DSM 8903 / Tp8T 6331) TaxID=351627 RepID=A4XIH0_CALS8|nr:glycosyltransferase family 4 protein [Caldicellulosiruptor saccharolyticus]ABP66705.1 glycosyl transferase, group 1 [Caldicellulosiruptor saccharolyticus DSM 8903]